jgi:hypothetical protein
MRAPEGPEAKWRKRWVAAVDCLGGRRSDGGHGVEGVGQRRTLDVLQPAEVVVIELDFRETTGQRAGEELQQRAVDGIPSQA